jgi:uncharacterized membrane protein YeaQ/YmgE (transglycosylase-associated protein family)
MVILSSIILGLIVGFLARGIMPGEQKMGWVLTCLLGIGGSVLASFAGQTLGWYAPGEPASWFASAAGALALLFVVGQLRGGSKG